ncbi:MAG: hypothetical protein MUF28_07745 [Ignavibacterium sp.]|jgi:uncharacterized membrane protein|nr:hypothetical protein [Ignavibacterium sp.]
MEFLADIHPKIIHFPIAFLMIYPFLELAFLLTSKEFFSKASILFLTLGVIGALFAVLSGNQAFEFVNNWSDEGRKIFNEHQKFANLTVWYFTAILIIRYYLFVKKKLKRTFISIIFVISLLGVYFIYQAGSLGGKLAEQIVINSTSSIESEN